jgi:hypothetical protein
MAEDIFFSIQLTLAAAFTYVPQSFWNIVKTPHGWSTQLEMSIERFFFSNGRDDLYLRGKILSKRCRKSEEKETMGVNLDVTGRWDGSETSRHIDLAEYRIGGAETLAGGDAGIKDLAVNGLTAIQTEIGRALTRFLGPSDPVETL